MSNRRMFCPEDFCIGILPALAVMGFIIAALCSCVYFKLIPFGDLLGYSLIVTFVYGLYSVFFSFYKTYGLPDFVTRHGIKVWTHKQPVNKVMMEQAVTFYINKVVDTDIHLSKARLFMLCGQVCIEWYKGKAHHTNIGWDVAEDTGAMIWRYARLKWCGHISDSMLFHMLHHMVANTIYGDPDVRHSRKEFWEACKDITTYYSLIEKQE